MSHARPLESFVAGKGEKMFFYGYEMNLDVRWKQRFECLNEAFRLLREAAQRTLQEPQNYLYQIALIGAFQFTFELSWKAMGAYLAYQGIYEEIPRDIIKHAFRYELIQDGEIWIHMLEEGNLISHAHQESAALTSSKNIREKYVHAIEQLHDFLLKRHIPVPPMLST